MPLFYTCTRGGLVSCRISAEQYCFFRQIAISLNTGMFITDVRLSLFNAKWHTYLARNFKKKKKRKINERKKGTTISEENRKAQKRREAYVANIAIKSAAKICRTEMKTSCSSVRVCIFSTNRDNDDSGFVLAD